MIRQTNRSYHSTFLSSKHFVNLFSISNQKYPVLLFSLYRPSSKTYKVLSMEAILIQNDITTTWQRFVKQLFPITQSRSADKQNNSGAVLLCKLRMFAYCSVRNLSLNHNSTPDTSVGVYYMRYFFDESKQD